MRNRSLGSSKEYSLYRGFTKCWSLMGRERGFLPSQV